MTPDATPAPGADELCVQCGHPWIPHQVFGAGDPPREGWIECPVQGCTCRMTWSVDASPDGSDEADPAPGE